MAAHSAVDQLHLRLRQLVIADPREANRVFLELLDSNSSDLEPFLKRIAAPADGRLRQMVANSIRDKGDQQKLLDHFLQWRAEETDEFTKRAINAVLSEVDLSSVSNARAPAAGVFDERLLEAYRYVSERLNHKVRNAMIPAQNQLLRLGDQVSKLPPQSGVTEQVAVTLAKLKDAILTVDRVVEYMDADPGHFELKTVFVRQWLKEMNRVYGSRFSAIKFEFQSEDSEDCPLLGSDFLLETIFWNLWINAHQAIGSDCAITVRTKRVGDYLEIVVSDNGMGVPEQIKDTAFKLTYSTRSQHRGRGLLEVQDAVQRLRGRVEMFEEASGVYRIRLFFPVQQS